MFRHSALGLFLIVALSACGGGGASVSTLPKSPQIPVGTANLQRVTFSIRVPAATGTSALSRRPLYVSTATQSAAIAVNGGAPLVVNLAANSPNCTAAAGGRTCTATVSAPVGADTFAETLFGSTNGTGPALSQNTTTATIVAGTANVVTLTLDGVVASIALSLADPAPPIGPTATILLVVNAKDASGATIIGNDPFANPIALTDSDTSGITALTKATVTSPADVINVTYNGKSLASATFTGSATGATSGSVTLTPSATNTIFNDYTTFGYDNQRDVYNPNSTSLTPTTLPSLHLAWQADIGDFNTQTQPILATEVPGHAGVLFVGGGSGGVYGYDALTGAQIWTQSLGQMTYTCGGGSQSVFGVGGSAAYDPASKSLYIVDASNSSQNGYSTDTLWRLDAATGAKLGSVNFEPPQIPGVTSELNFTHTAVTLSNGVAYVGTSSTCDVSAWRGAVVAINVPAMAVASRFFTLWDPQNTRGQGAQPWSGGGVWGWGGVSLDGGGNVFTGVGNTDQGFSNGTLQAPYVAPDTEYAGYAETLLQLSGGLSYIASNHPIPHNTYSNTANDLDVQGTPLVLTPNGAGCSTMLALQGKSGELNLYNENSLGSGPVQQYQLATTNGDDAYLGSPAYSPATGLIYAAVATSASPTMLPSGLAAINPGCGSPSFAWNTAFGVDSNSQATPRSVPAVSAGGVVLAGSVGAGGGGDLWALDASTGALLSGTPILHTSSTLRVPATIDGKWVFVLDNAGDLYGLTTDPSVKAIAAKYRSVTPHPLHFRNRRL
jgi:outer membrane protein assembly factor BamB